jgi:hypothetical protein
MPATITAMMNVAFFAESTMLNSTNQTFSPCFCKQDDANDPLMDYESTHEN